MPWAVSRGPATRPGVCQPRSRGVSRRSCSSGRATSCPACPYGSRRERPDSRGYPRPQDREPGSESSARQRPCATQRATQPGSPLRPHCEAAFSVSASDGNTGAPRRKGTRAGFADAGKVHSWSLHRVRTGSVAGLWEGCGTGRAPALGDFRNSRSVDAAPGNGHHGLRTDHAPARDASQ